MTRRNIKTAESKSGAATAPNGRIGGRFAPGRSGNPRGRPRETPEEFALLSKIRSLSDKAVRALESVLDDDDAPADAKIKAANIVIERQLGKLKQEIDSNVTQHQATAQDFKPDLANLRPRAVDQTAFECRNAERDAAHANKSDHPASMDIRLSEELATGATN